MYNGLFSVDEKMSQIFFMEKYNIKQMAMILKC